MNDALRIILPVYLATFFAIGVAWRSYLIRKRTGINPFVVGKSGGTIDFIGKLYALPIVLILASVLMYSVFPEYYQYTLPIPWLDSSYIKLSGLILMAVALVWTATAQMQMGTSWRIGIDTKNETELIRKGLFRVSRNPIFLGMRIALFGFFLSLPNAFTLLAAVVADVLMQIQVRLEEEFLTRAHGEKYAEFCKEVRRWI
jgi:protein-S-isoprenylcysteine O-methyltransferase Ste14